MFAKKKNTLKYTPLALALEIAGVGLLMGVLVITVNHYPNVPDMIPKHFDIRGVADGWAGRQAALLMPLFAIYLYIILTGIGIIARRQQRPDDQQSVLVAALMMMLCGKVAVLVYACVRTYSVMHVQNMPIWSALILPVGLGLTIMIGALYIKRSMRLHGWARVQDQ